jgi:hypothetical protein
MGVPPAAWTEAIRSAMHRTIAGRLFAMVPPARELESPRRPADLVGPRGTQAVIAEIEGRP